MWWVDYIYLGSFNGKIFPLCTFRIIFALCCLLKFFIETRRGYYNYFKPISFLYFLYRISHKRNWINNRIYHILYFSKIGAAICVLLGILTTPMLIVLAIAFAIEMKIYFKFHTNLFFLICCFLALSPCADILSYRDVELIKNYSNKEQLFEYLGKEGDLWAQIAIVLTVSVVYIATAIHKCNYSFLSGQVVLQTSNVLSQKGNRLYRDITFFSISKAPINIIVLLMYMTVMVELILPFLLSFRPLFGVSLGLFTHMSFLCLGTGTLLHFSILMVSSYMLFCNPSSFYDLIMILYVKILEI